MEDLAIPSPLALNGYWAALLFSCVLFFIIRYFVARSSCLSAQWDLLPKGYFFFFFLDDEPRGWCLGGTPRQNSTLFPKREGDLYY